MRNKNAEFTDNVVAMSAYSKNWRFAAQEMSVKNVKFRRNNVEVDIEELAEVTVFAGVDINGPPAMVSPICTLIGLNSNTSSKQRI